MKISIVSKVALVASMVASAAAFAQTSSAQTNTGGAGRTGGFDGDGWFARPSAGSSTSYIPFTSNGYVGISAGRSKYDLNCVGPFSCDQRANGFKVFTGGQLSRVVGLDLAYLHMGSVDRNGGNSRAHGLGLNAVANLPIWNFNAFAKLGTTYGWTRTTSATPLAATGSERGFGLSYGAGVQYDFTEVLGARVEWDRVRFRFVDGRDSVNLLSAGLVLNF